jgi:acetyltransferase-like isoleucine patch superfamily enzyme
MQKSIVLLFKALRWIWSKFLAPIDWIINCFLFYINGVQFSTFKNYGWPLVHISNGGTCVIGAGFVSNNRVMSNPIGRFHKCSIVVGNKGKLLIGSNVGISSTAIVCHDSITIGDNVNIGGNVVIYDTDFHSHTAKDRLDRAADRQNTLTKAVVIGNNAFIGAHTTILKGARIGENSIIGACSVVTKNVPENEIWAGNPIKFIRALK